MDKEEKAGKLTNRELFDRQMEMLKGFLRSGAITRAQYETSAEGLRKKMKL
jgi:hypothetical protein